MQISRIKPMHNGQVYQQQNMNNQIPLKTIKKLTPLNSPTHIQTNNPKHHNKKTNNKLMPSTQNNLKNKYAKNPINTHYQIKPTHKATKTRKSISNQYQKTKLNYKHARPNNKTQKPPTK